MKHLKLAFLLPAIMSCLFGCAEDNSSAPKKIAATPSPAPTPVLPSPSPTPSSANSGAIVAVPQPTNPLCNRPYACSTAAECYNIFLCTTLTQCAEMIKIRQWGYVPLAAPRDATTGALLPLCANINGGKGGEIVPDNVRCMRDSIKACWAEYNPASTAVPSTTGVDTTTALINGVLPIISSVATGGQVNIGQACGAIAGALNNPMAQVGCAAVGTLTNQPAPTPATK